MLIPRVAAVRLLMTANLLLVGVSQIAAQALPPPTTSTGGLFGRRVARDVSGAFVNELTVTFDAGGGSDINQGLDAGNDQGDQQGVITNAGATVQHRIGTTRRSLESSGRAYVSRGTVGIDQLTGAAATVVGEVAMGRRTGLTLNGNFGYEPTSLFNAFGPIQSDIDTGVPGASPPQGISDQRWFASQAGAGMYQRWTTRQRSAVQYSATRREVVSGVGLGSRGQVVGFNHGWNRWRRSSLNMRYNWDEQRQGNVDGRDIPVTTHAADIGLRFGRMVSPRRRIEFTVSAGATRAEALSGETLQPEAFTMPTVSGTVRLDLSRSWTLDADARRDVSLLQGITPLPFKTRAFSARAGGNLGARVQLAFSASRALGAAGDGTGAYSTTIGTVQLQMAASRHLAVFFGYSYYDHEVQDVIITTPGFPDNFTRRSARAGVTCWLPVFGRF